MTQMTMQLQNLARRLRQVGSRSPRATGRPQETIVLNGDEDDLAVAREASKAFREALDRIAEKPKDSDRL
jgi:hypothetical protein